MCPGEGCNNRTIEIWIGLCPGTSYNVQHCAGISSLLQCLGQLSQLTAIDMPATLGIAVGPIYQHGALKNHIIVWLFPQHVCIEHYTILCTMESHYLCSPTSFAVNTLRPRQNGSYFPDNIFKCILLNENVWISIKISLQFVHESPVKNIPALVQTMAWHWLDYKPLS